MKNFFLRLIGRKPAQPALVPVFLVLKRRNEVVPNPEPFPVQDTMRAHEDVVIETPLTPLSSFVEEAVEIARPVKVAKAPKRIIPPYNPNAKSLPRMNAAKKTKALELRAQGKTFTQIANALKTPRYRVVNYFADLAQQQAQPQEAAA